MSLATGSLKQKASHPTEPEKVKTHELNLANNSENPPGEHYAHGEQCGMLFEGTNTVLELVKVQQLPNRIQRRVT